MIMSAIFIETFFSTCGACAPADAVNAIESIAMPRNLLVNDMFSSLSERSRWRDLRLQHHSDLDISPSPRHVVSMGGKWVEALKETAPHITRALAIMHPETLAHQGMWQSSRKQSRPYRVTCTMLLKSNASSHPSHRNRMAG